MNLLAKSLSALAVIAVFSSTKPETKPVKPMEVPPYKIQVAILLDVSGSMEGLIDQAKTQLWNMVNTLGKAECNNNTKPQIELALYEYGRTNNDQGKGYVKQLSAFTNDLDSVSKILFGLSTDGGDEYCGQVIYTSMDELKWDAAKESYKVIFIAGNEDFLQGNVKYTQACTKAKEKNIIVNTIYCGDYQSGIAEHWNLGGECSNGNFMNIDQNAKEKDIPTPYDQTLVTLNEKLNSTYIGYGATGAANIARQGEVDKMNSGTMNGYVSRANAKAQSNVYNNASWDLVDASKADSAYFLKIDKNTLPDSLKNKSTEQLKKIVKEKATERGAIQSEIITVNANRSRFIAEEKAKASTNKAAATLETAVEKTIKEQVQRYNMRIN